MQTPGPGNPITGAILTTRNAVHYTTTANGDELLRPLTRCCDGHPVNGATRTTVGALTRTRCAARADRHNWPMDGATNTTALHAGMTVILTRGFAAGTVANIQAVTSHMDPNDTDGLTHHISDTVRVHLGAWGTRTLNADILTPHTH
jgi:hypothetical protein